MVRFVLMATGLLSCALLACGPNRDLYVGNNEALLATLPLFPNAAEAARESNEYTFEDGGLFDAPEGYGTRVTLRVPAGTTAEAVRDFYLTAVDGTWTPRLETIPVIELLPMLPGPADSSGPAITPATTAPAPQPHVQLHFCRGDALVGIDTANVERNGTYDVYVDHNYGQSGQRAMLC